MVHEQKVEDAPWTKKEKMYRCLEEVHIAFGETVVSLM